MLTSRRTILGLALLLATIGDSSGQSPPEPPRQNPGGAQQQPNTEQRDTDQAPPSIIKPMPAEQTQQKPTDREQNGPENRSNAWTLSDKIAIVASIAAMLQFVALVITIFVLIHTAKRQLRAYVSVIPSGLRKISPTENFHFSLVQLNGGQTPAYSLSQDGELLLVNHPLPETFPFPALTRPRGSKTMVPPNTQFTGHLLATRQFTKDEIIEILEGKAAGGKRLYVFGQVDYIDAFKKAHWTRYCFSLPGWLEAVVPARRDQWGDIATKLNQPGFALNFEIASQHNVTDDG